MIHWVVLLTGFIFGISLQDFESGFMLFEIKRGIFVIETELRLSIRQELYSQKRKEYCNNRFN
jgi:hypothetical protein